MSFLLDPLACIVCMKMVSDDERGVQCDSGCERWFHSSCVKISDAEYRKLASNSNTKWICNRSDCVKPNQHPLNQLVTKMESISSQMERMLNKLDALASLPDDVAAIKTELFTVNDKLNNFEPRISEAERRISALNDNLNALKAGGTGSVSVDSVIEEISDRNRRACNIILYGISECKSKTLSVRISHDNDLVSTLVQPFCKSGDDHSFKSFRIGKSSTAKPRPLKVIFKHSGSVQEFAKNFDSTVLSDINPNFENVSFSRDRTLHERKQLSDLRTQLKERQDGGEADLTIKYVNGAPKIVKKNPKND